MFVGRFPTIQTLSASFEFEQLTPRNSKRFIENFAATFCSLRLSRGGKLWWGREILADF